LQSGLGVTVSQPLLRDLKIDAARQQLAVNRTNREIADTRLRESLVHTTAAVKVAYWNLVSARANVVARKSTLESSEELARVNKAKVDVGTLPPLDLLSAQAEVAANQEQLIIAETSVKQAEDRLRLLIFDTTRRDNWNVPLEPVDSPPTAIGAVDVDAAITRALAERADLARNRKEIDNAQTSLKFANNQRLPDVRLNASYQASGLGGTQVLRSGGFPGTIVGPGAVTDFGNVVNQLFAHDYPTWSVGVSVSYPIGESADQANYARAQLERSQAAERLKSNEGKAIQQIRDAAWKIDMNAKRIETTRAARDLAEQRLDAERKRFDVGMSTSFLVIQAQRDLAQARTNELSAVLAYDLSLVDFDMLQQAGPTGSGGSSGSGGSGAAAPAAAPAGGGGATASRPTGATAGLPGVPQGQ
jgi:outer membrane protein TolC